MVNLGLTERDLGQIAEASFSDFLCSLSRSVRSIQQEPRHRPLDMIAKADFRGKPIALLAGGKTRGEPRYLRQAADQLRRANVGIGLVSKLKQKLMDLANERGDFNLSKPADLKEWVCSCQYDDNSVEKNYSNFTPGRWNANWHRYSFLLT